MKKGYFGEFGGCFVPELLMPPLLEVEAAMRDIMPTQQFQDELQDLLHNYAGRPTPLTFCPRLSEELGFELWLKREDLLHSGAHKINNTLGQALLAKYMGKTALVAETGAGQHGVATAVAAARLGMSCTIYMGAEDVERQAPNVMRMRLLGATVHPVESSRMPSTRPCVPGSSASRPRITASARLPGPIPSPRWCACSSRSSARKCGNRCWPGPGACRTPW